MAKKATLIELEMQRLTGGISRLSEGRIDQIDAGALLDEIMHASGDGATQEQLVAFVASCLDIDSENKIASNIIQFIYSDAETVNYKPFDNEKLQALKDIL